MKFADYEAMYPDHELIQYMNTKTPIEGCPKGFICLIAVPKARIAEVEAKGGKAPWWRHGELIHVRPEGEPAFDQGAPSSLQLEDGSASGERRAA